MTSNNEGEFQGKPDKEYYYEEFEEEFEEEPEEEVEPVEVSGPTQIKQPQADKKHEYILDLLDTWSHFMLSPLAIAFGALLPTFVIILTIGLTVLYNTEYKKYHEEKDAVQLLRGFIIGDDEKLSQASNEVLFSLMSNKIAGLVKLKDTIRQLRSEAQRVKELTSGIIGHGHPFNQTLFYIPKKTATFHQAIQECAKINATLVSVMSTEEQRFINHIVHRQLANEHWIGIYRSAKTKYNWAWIDKDLKYDIEYWNTIGNHPRQQQYLDGGPNCVANTKQCEDFQRGIWNRCWEDRNCSEFYHFICRIPKNKLWV